MEKYLTIGQAAESLGISSGTLRRWDKSGRFPSSRHPINNYRIYPTDQVNSLKEQLAIYFTKKDTELAKKVKPYFKTNFGQLYKLDVIDFLKTLDNESVDLIFADPPYNIKKVEWDTFESQRQYVDWCMEWINECQRVLTKKGTLYICGFSEILADVKWAASHLFKGCKWLTWYYRNKANMSDDWGRSHESLLHFRKSRDFIFNTDKVRIPYNVHTLKYPNHPQAETSQYGNGKKYVWTPHPKGARPKDVFEIPTISNSSWEKYKHPTQKPVHLVKKCILASSNFDSLIVDPFGGSGTTFAIAEAFQRKWSGSENNSKYCKMIKERLSNSSHLERIRKGEDEIKSQKLREKLRR